MIPLNPWKVIYEKCLMEHFKLPYITFSSKSVQQIYELNVYFSQNYYVWLRSVCLRVKISSGWAFMHNGNDCVIVFNIYRWEYTCENTCETADGGIIKRFSCLGSFGSCGSLCMLFFRYPILIFNIPNKVDILPSPTFRIWQTCP